MPRGSNPPEGAFNIPTNPNCEAKAREFFDVMSHGTPGVVEDGYASKCPNYDVQKNLHPLASVAAGAPEAAQLAGAPGTACEGGRCA